MPNVKCTKCGKIFERNLFQLKRAKKRFCSTECRLSYSTFKGNKYNIKEQYAEIIIDSHKYGIKKALIDKEFVDICSKFTWRLSTKDQKNFYVISQKTNILKLHSLILSYNGDKVIDHINRNPLDNRIENLRIVSVSENIQNSKLRKDSTSGHKGITWSKSDKAWKVKIHINNKCISLGMYKDIEPAIVARKNAEAKYFTPIIKTERDIK